MTTSSINWSNIFEMSTSQVNWHDLGIMTDAQVNWDDLSDIGSANVDWSDLAVMTHSEINWSDMSVMTTSTIDWNQMEYFSSNAMNLIDTMQIVFNTIGNVMTDTQDSNTLYGKVLKILAAIEEADLTTIKNILGQSSDSADSGTIFGDINNIQDSIGVSSTATTVFDQMDIIQDFAKKGKDSADAALGVTKNIETDLGVFGQTPNMNDQIKLLKDHIQDIQNAAIEIAQQNQSTASIAQQLVEMVRGVINEQAKLSGLEDTGMQIEQLSSQQARDMEKVSDKLVEIDTKVQALREAMQVDDVVIKTWFESEE
jgi:hypothetical protein